MDMSNVSELMKSKKIQPSSLRFGFLGLGIMASGIVKNLINFEHRVNLWCETPSKVSTYFFCLYDRVTCLGSTLALYVMVDAFGMLAVCAWLCHYVRFYLNGKYGNKIRSVFKF